MNQRDAGQQWWPESTMTPLAGGYSGETFLVGEADEQVVLRIYAREPDRAAVDASLLRLVRGIIPVPEVVDQRPAVDGKPGILVTRRLPGESLDRLMTRLDAAALAKVGAALGRVLARLSGIPMLSVGTFVDAELRVSPEALPADDLPSWAETFRRDGRLAGWPDRDWEALLELLDQSESLLTEPASPEKSRPVARHVLVHSDFNPKNLLMDRDTMAVTGVLDWEFAHAGSPYADLGNLTRFEREPAFVDAVLGSLVAHAPELGRDPLRLARCADLWALVELAGRERTNAVTEMAAELLRAQASAGDVMAWPWKERRRSPAAQG